MNTFCLSHSFVLGDVVVVCLLGDVGAGLDDLVLGASAAHPPAAGPHLTCAHTRTCHRLRLGPVLVAAIAAARGRDNLLHGRKPPCPLATTTATTRPGTPCQGRPLGGLYSPFQSLSTKLECICTDWDWQNLH